MSLWKRILLTFCDNDNVPHPPVVDMTAEEKAVIVNFAKGDNRLREEAIVIHRAYIRTLGVRGTIYQRFMAEVDNPVPDHYQRRIFREELLKASG